MGGGANSVCLTVWNDEQQAPDTVFFLLPFSFLEPGFLSPSIFLNLVGDDWIGHHGDRVGEVEAEVLLALDKCLHAIALGPQRQ